MELLQKFRQREPYSSQLTAHSSQLTAHSSQLTAHSSQLTAHSSQLTLKFRRRLQKIKRQTLSVLLIFSLLLSQLTSLFVPVAYAASSPWSQTNWNGGSGQTSWSDATKYDSSSNVTTSTANQVTLTATSPWYNASWAYRKKITFNNSAQAENLTNFPVLVKLSSSNFDFTKAQSAGQDIRFTDSDGTTALSYEIESWDNSGQTANVWVKVPQIDLSSATDNIYMYYGNSSAADSQAATSVWDSGTVGDWHLKESGNGTSGEFKDSTSHANNGQGGAGTAAAVPTLTSSGQINGAQSFDGGDYIDLDGSQLRNTNFTISLWVKPSSLTSVDTVYSNGNTTNTFGTSFNINQRATTGGQANGYVAVWYHSTVNGPGPGGWNAVETSSAVLSTSSWTHLVWTKNNGVSSIYVNGVLNNSTTFVNTDIAYGSSDAAIGFDFGSNGGKTHGSIDEVRISNSARTAAWIAASYKTENDTFNTFASEEQEYPSSGTLTSSIFDTEISAGAAWGTLTFAATTPTSTTATVKVRTSNSSSMVGATAFSSCNAITSGTDISSNNCVTDSHRYAQYLITLGTSAPASTPTFTSFSLAFSSYDADAPSISLTALTPDPNSDNTPTLSGTATDSIGTVSNVQFQMDSTSGSWTACSASDGSFNSASEAFSCTASTLTDGSHTMYVRATDSNGNTTSSSYASDTFTIDATNPVSIDLDSPGDNSYTNNERPTFKWKATTDATAGLSKYVLEIDNPSIGSSQLSGDFSIDNIPTSGTSDITSNNKYVIHFDGFSDSDSTNNYISVYTRSTNDWGSSENDGKLREGRVSWKVKAVDNAGNESSSSRTLFVDRTSPNVEFTQINSTPYTSNNFSTTDKTPTIFGKITDPLAGADNNGQTIQDENGLKVASGPKEVNIKIEKKNGLTYSLVTLYKINMDNPYYTCEPGKTIDNSKQKCDKYLPFEYTPKENLDLGTYKITLTGKDKADNNSSETILTLNITTLAQITTPQEKKTIEEETKTLKPEEKQQIKQELEITKPTEQVPVSALEKAGQNITQASKNFFDGLRTLAHNVITGIGNGIAFVFNKTGEGIAFVFNKTGQSLAFIFNKTGEGLAFILDKTGQGLAFVSNGIGTGLHNAGEAIGSGYNNIAYHAPGITKNILLAIGNGFSTTGNFIGATANNIGTGIHNTGTSIAQGFINTKNAAGNGIANIAFAIGEKTDDVSHEFGTAIIKIGYLFVPEPTRIYDVQVVTLSPTSAKISWKTNHPANGKVNYGLDETYPSDVQTEKRTNNHEFTLNNLKPDTQYYFEVMSQNRNYVYDANRKFHTPAK